MMQPVDEGRRRPVHAASNAAQEVLVDQIGVDVLGEPLAEQVEIEVEHPSVRVEIVGRKALVNIAAKIGEYARPGEVLVSQDVVGTLGSCRRGIHGVRAGRAERHRGALRLHAAHGRV